MKDKKGILIGILLVIILVMASYITLDKLFLEKKVVSEPTKKNSNDNLSMNLNAFYQIGDTLNQFDAAFGDVNSTYFGYIYKKDKLVVEKFDKTAALYLAIHSELTSPKTTPYITGTKVKNRFEKIFGKQLTYTPGNIQAGNSYNITYDSNSNNYVYYYQTTKADYSPEYLTHTISTKVKDGKVIVTRKAYYVEYGNNGGGNVSTATIYTDSDKSVKVGDLTLRNNVLNEKEVIDKYASKLKTFEYTFILKTEDDCSFYSIKKTK